MVVRSTRTLKSGGVLRVIVVTGFEGEAVRAVFSGEERSAIEFVENSDHALGMGTSIACGMSRIPTSCTGVLIALGDMPTISPVTIRALIAAHQRAPNAAIAPSYQGDRGHPVLFPISAVAQLAALRGDRGARAVYRAQSQHIEIAVDDPGVMADVDTLTQLSQLSDDKAPILACAFDAYGTLFDVAGSRDMLNAVLGEVCGDAVLSVWRQKQLEYTWLRSLAGAWIDFWQLTSEALDIALETEGVNDQRLRKDLLEHYRTLPAYADAAPTLKNIRERGVRTAILSNGEPTMLADAARAAKLDDLLDLILSASEVAVFKPDPKIYQLAVDRLNAPRENVAFLTANAWDAAGAAYFGLQVVWVNRFGRPRERLPGTLRATVTQLSGVADVLWPSPKRPKKS